MWPVRVNRCEAFSWHLQWSLKCGVSTFGSLNFTWTRVVSLGLKFLLRSQPHSLSDLLVQLLFLNVCNNLPNIILRMLNLLGIMAVDLTFQKTPKIKIQWGQITKRRLQFCFFTEPQNSNHTSPLKMFFKWSKLCYSDWVLLKVLRGTSEWCSVSCINWRG